jgi:threonine synthase
MRYLSTRGQVRGIPFKEAVMMGLAEDGGLLLPESIPQLTADELTSLARLPYPELAFQLLSKFIDDIPAADLKALIDRSYATFTHPAITPVVKHGDVHILELFHGPTLAFKDVALQLLGNLFEYLLLESGAHMNILGATSGDTGSAAIYGVRGKRGINIFILHPHGKVSKVQELQMTTVTDPNVFNLAIRGTFDDGQRIVKEIFGDLEFKKRHALGAVNSINWARVLAQVVYYVYAWGQVNTATGCREVTFSVPTGNFGDIFAGYVAKRMGVPIRRLILASNANNILARFVNAGDYSIGAVHPTLSPSMDIQVASNFERYLFYLYGEDPARVCAAFAEFAETGRLVFSAEERRQISATFLAHDVDDAGILAEIRDFYATTGYILDPHTAVGVRAAHVLPDDDSPVICLATAHPAKFPDAVHQAIGRNPQRPTSLDGLEERPRRCETIAAETAVIQEFVSRNAL